ncbi:MAG: hypothetical protein ACKN85_03165, partial [Pirellula sp.]
MPKSSTKDQRTCSQAEKTRRRLDVCWVIESAPAFGLNQESIRRINRSAIGALCRFAASLWRPIH